MINKAIKRKWLKALRSGEYAQGKVALCKVGKDYDRFCCLGVLINEVEGFDLEGTGYQSNLLGMSRGLYYTFREFKMPNDKFLEDVGLEKRDAEYLAKMNDKGKTFKTIANYIEKNL